MSRPGFVCLLVFNMVAAIAVALPAHAPTPESTARQHSIRCSSKSSYPVTKHTPKQDGPVVEAWVAKQLKQLGETHYFCCHRLGACL